MIRAVLDCNVVITAALTGGRCADPLVRARRKDGFQLVWSPPIVAECFRVIEYPKLSGKLRSDPRLLVERAMASAHMVPTDLLPAIDVVKADPSDNSTHRWLPNSMKEGPRGPRRSGTRSPGHPVP